jgi:hypothetical protein
VISFTAANKSSGITSAEFLPRAGDRDGDENGDVNGDVNGDDGDGAGDDGDGAGDGGAVGMDSSADSSTPSRCFSCICPALPALLRCRDTRPMRASSASACGAPSLADATVSLELRSCMPPAGTELSSPQHKACAYSDASIRSAERDAAAACRSAAEWVPAARLCAAAFHTLPLNSFRFW